MGSEYKRRQKELHGQNSVRGYDVHSAGATISSGATAHTAAADAHGVTSWTAPLAGLIDYIVADITPTVASGVLNYSVAKAGVVVASGTLISTASNIYSTELNNEVDVDAGDVFQIAYAIPEELGALGSAISTSFAVRVGLRYKER